MRDLVDAGLVERRDLEDAGFGVNAGFGVRRD